MAFRKRNVVLGKPPSIPSDVDNTSVLTASGVRPSPLASHSVTSTGTQSLDDLLGGHGGLALGSSLLIEECGTTDFAGALLRYYAAEGICHDHAVHVVGVGEGWVRNLPAVATEKTGRKAAATSESEKMKIAWRYERLGNAADRALPDRTVSAPQNSSQDIPFCHFFDLSKRMITPPNAKVNHIPIRPSANPFDAIISSLTQSLETTSSNSVHRLVIPTILSPALYPPTAGRPENYLRFLHSLRCLLAKHSTRLTALITLPLELHPRSSALVRWAEHLSSSVLELTPFPHLMDASNSLAESGGARGSEEQPQGMLSVHKLPVSTERGEGGAGVNESMGQDLAFTVSRRKFVIKPFSLPPLEGDQEAQSQGGNGLTGKDVQF